MMEAQRILEETQGSQTYLRSLAERNVRIGRGQDHCSKPQMTELVFVGRRSPCTAATSGTQKDSFACSVAMAFLLMSCLSMLK